MSAMLNSIVRDCGKLRKTLQPISERYHGLLCNKTTNNTKSPFVLLLGNNSSGKSNFIDHILNRKIQSTDGFSSSDDCFTIIGSSNVDIDRPGPTLLGDSDLGFNGLQSLGSGLVDHTQLKLRSDVAIKDFMIVDSPNMMDTSASNSTDIERNANRNYCFEDACKWFAERADVILLFFDPNKPGAPGETISTLTKSLRGFEDKLFLVLNKTDAYQTFQDFTHTYGQLCWNLSKITSLKDLPRIHTMCLPESEDYLDGMSECTMDKSRNMSISYADQRHISLHETREEVIREVYNAPRRRIDNEISRLTDSVGGLLMHCNIVNALVSKYESKLWKNRLYVGATAVASVGATLAVGYLIDIHNSVNAITDTFKSCAKEINSTIKNIASESVQHYVNEAMEYAIAHPKTSTMIATSAIGVLSTLSMSLQSYFQLNNDATELASQSSYLQTMEEVCNQGTSPPFTKAMKILASDKLSQTLTADTIKSMQRANVEDIRELERVLTIDVSELKLKAKEVQCSSPLHHFTPLNHMNSVWFNEVETSYDTNVADSIASRLESNSSPTASETSELSDDASVYSVMSYAMNNSCNNAPNLHLKNASQCEIHNNSSENVGFWSNFYLDVAQVRL